MRNSKSIGNKIASARKRVNLSQAELGQQISISPQAIGKWERGESMPDITMLNKLTAIFKVDLNYFSDAIQESEVSTLDYKKIETPLSDNPTPHPNKKFDWNWDMSKGNWVDADFSGLKDLKEKFSGSNIKNCKFLNSELTDLIFKGNNIENSDFSGSDLRNSKIQASNISKNNFTASSFIDAEFETSEIYNCNFSNVNFSGVEFKTSDFRNNKIENAKWNLTSFKSTSLSELIFNGTLENCSFENCGFSKVVFENAILKNTFFKNNKNLKRVKFIDCKADRITFEFLKSGYADVTSITILNP